MNAWIRFEKKPQSRNWTCGNFSLSVSPRATVPFHLPSFIKIGQYYPCRKSQHSRESWRRQMCLLTSGVLDDKRRAKIAFSSCAMGTDNSSSSVGSHSLIASYRRYESRLSQYFRGWEEGERRERSEKEIDSSQEEPVLEKREAAGKCQERSNLAG